MIERRLIVYYSWIGSTKVVCEFIAKETGIPIVRIEEVKPRPFGKIMSAAMAAFFGARSAIKPLDRSLEDVTTLVIGMPIWAGKTPPAINAFFRKTAFKGKEVWIVTTMGSDKPALEWITSVAARIERKGGILKGLTPIQTHWEPETNLPISEEEIREKADQFIARAGFPVVD
jgi:flavodoxin